MTEYIDIAPRDDLPPPVRTGVGKWITVQCARLMLRWLEVSCYNTAWDEFQKPDADLEYVNWLWDMASDFDTRGEQNQRDLGRAYDTYYQVKQLRAVA